MSARGRLAAARATTWPRCSSSTPSTGSSSPSAQPPRARPRSGCSCGARGRRWNPSRRLSRGSSSTSPTSTGLLSGLDKEALLGAVVELDDLRKSAGGLAVAAGDDLAEAGALEQFADEILGEERFRVAVPEHLGDELPARRARVGVGDEEV